MGDGTIGTVLDQGRRRLSADGHPLVSVITPVRNREKSIRKTLASVSAQTYPNIEHIVIDGASTDRTVQILDNYISRHSLSYISEPDSGMYEAINKGLERAGGEILCYLNSDDLFFPWSVQTAVETLRRSYGFTFGDAAIVRHKDDQPVGRVRLQTYPRFSLKRYATRAILAQPTVFWSADVTRTIGRFDASLNYAGDTEYWLRAAFHGYPFIHVSEFMGIQVDHDQTLSLLHKDALEEELVRIRSKYVSSTSLLSHRLVRRLGDSLRWRRLQFDLRRQAKRPVPSRWPQFIRFLKSFNIEFQDKSAYRFFFPIRGRPGRSLLLEAETLEEMLRQVVTAESSSSSNWPREDGDW
jgi:glycosyltransferase involved in cell wall biosynthesis